MDIKEIINQRYAMPDASLDRLRQCLTEVSYPKGFRVLESGKIEKDIFCTYERHCSRLHFGGRERNYLLDWQGRGDHCFYERIRER